MPVSLLITTDEETTKQGAREIAARSELVRRAKPRGILVVEPTRMVPVRGHRSHIVFTAVATGVQAHSSTGRGRNANWALLPFMMEMRALYRAAARRSGAAGRRLRSAVQRLQHGDRQPRHGGERDRAEGDRDDQVPLLRRHRPGTHRRRRA